MCLVHALRARAELNALCATREREEARGIQQETVRESEREREAVRGIQQERERERK